MTQQENSPQNLQLRQIRRKKVYLGLAIAAGLAFLVSRCDDSDNDENANEPIDAVFYQTTAQCEADINKQTAEYMLLQKKYSDGQLADPPTPPPMQVADCAHQMLAAQQEYQNTVPIYATIEDCQEEGVQCEATSPAEQTVGYRPVYGGTYIDISNTSSHVYNNYGGSQYPVYAVGSVYQSITPGRIVTSYGREIAQASTGRVTVPRHTIFAAPARPIGTSAKGTIRGRSSQGFGSSFKKTGLGGK